MAHYFDTGFSVRQPAWHHLATVLPDYPGSWDEARKAAGLDWDPIRVPTYEFRGLDDAGNPVHEPGDGVSGDYFPDPKRYRIARSDTGDTLAVANDSYQIITHAEMGQVVEAILEQPNVRYETAGSLHEGRAVWALALLDEPVQLEGTYGRDESLTLPYLSILNRHDGRAALQVQSTTVRIVCANTWRASELESERTGTAYSFRHTRHWASKIDEAREVIRGVRREFAAYTELASDLLGMRVDAQQTERFIREFVPEPPVGLTSERVRENIENARNAMRTILASSTTQPIAHTAFGLVQAAGEYADHVRKAHSWETRLGRTLLRPAKLKIRAARLARQVANA